MKALADLIFTSDFFYSIFRVATPLLFASMGAVVSDVAGVPNIALEGMMLIAAFAGMYFSYLFGSAWAGLAFAILFAVLAAGVLAFFTLYYKTNIILGGIAINSLASG
ncbi:MAG: ABC transporter permease, partial [Clostridium sp.]|nr:ABC transporter permease [Clostridium sp.]